ncbi:MAG: efflux RND transporter permease subunit [Candidatus Paceibacterota bacterium]
MWEFFINNKRFSYLIVVVLLLFGLYSILSIPKESSPEVVVPIGIVTTILPGAPAVDIETQITNELERGLSGSLENVKKITSSSREGVSSITVEFEAEADLDKSIDSLKDEIDSLLNRLPADAERPVVSEVNFVDQPIMTIAVSGDRTEKELSVLAEDIIDELEGVSGVSRVEKSGARDQEVTILVDQETLLRYELSVTDVVQAIRVANVSFPIGQIVTDGVSYNIIFESNADAVELLSNIPITSLGGQPVLVADVAEVVVGLSPAITYSRLSVNNEPSNISFTLNVFKQSGGDITGITDDVEEKLDVLKSSLLNDLTVYTVYDAGEDIKSDLTQLTRSGLQTILFVIVILMLAIGWREGLIAGLAIPLSFMIGFIGLYLSGNTINFISLFALILGIGVLVDSGIVIVEGINKKISQNPNLDKTEAARQVIREFSFPLTSGTLTTVSMFVGLFIVSGVTGQFIASIPFTLIFILFASLLVALGFLPLITSKLIKKRATNIVEEKQKILSQKLENYYKESLTKIINSSKLKRRFISLIILGFVSAIALIPLGLVKVVFFEQSDINIVYIEVEEPEGTIKETTDLAVRKVEEKLFAYPEMIESYTTTIGSGNLFGSGGLNPKLGNIQLTLRDDRSMSSSAFIDILRTDLLDIKDAKITVNQPSDGPPVGAPIGVKLYGDDLRVLSDTANEIAQTLSEIPNTRNVKTSANTNTTEFVVNLDQEKASIYGLNSQLVSQTLRAAVNGTEAVSITSLNDDVEVIVRLNLNEESISDPEFANWTTLNRLSELELATPGGDRIPVSEVADITLRESSTVISHENQKRIMSVSADITNSGNVIEINRQLNEKLENEINLPEDVTYSFGGETEESDQAFKEMFLALIVGVVLMIGVLVFQFDSYRHTFYVLSILPFSLIGILYGLAITGSSLSFPSIMGFIALTGIIVNNSILLIDMMNRMRKENPTKSIHDVVIDSSTSRLRPILLTSITTIMGMVPLLSTDEIWIPLATAVMFGLAFSVVITLFLVPIIYSKWR